MAAKLGTSARSRRAQFEEGGCGGAGGLCDMTLHSSDGGVESDFLYMVKKRFLHWWTEPEHFTVKPKATYGSKDELVLVYIFTLLHHSAMPLSHPTSLSV